ncbi:MAG: transglycosylase domain-containing protein [Anaerolineae bacterium]
MSLSPAERILLERRLRRSRQGSAVAASAVGLGVALVVLVPVLLLAAALGSVGVAYAMLADELDQGVAKLGNLHERELFETTRIYDRNGTLLREVFVEGRRTYLPLEDIPETVIDATIAVEDRSFRTNPGVEATGILRAMQGELTGEPGLGGGSTITQQFVRHVAFSYDERIARSYTRKAKEIILALIMTRQYDKAQILEWYLNEIYYGNLAYGIEAAAQTIFDKPAKELDLAESALLAGLPQLPGQLDPLDPDPDVQRRVKERQKVVLDLMVRAGYISQSEADRAAKQEMEYRDSDDDLFLAPHFVVYVEDILEKSLDPVLLARGGLEITTTLDLSLQQLGERIVREHVEDLRDAHDLTNAALVALEPGTGQILAMVGSADYWDDEIDGRVNVAVRPRQPGSSIKPITYLTAVERGVSPGALLWDTHMELDLPGRPEPWEPQNYDEKFHGPVRLRDALANSYNIPALKLLANIPPLTAEDGAEFEEYMADLAPNYPDGAFPEGHNYAGQPVEVLYGLDQALATAHRLGIAGLANPADYYGLSLTLGGGEVTLLDLTTAYATLANLGERVRPNPIMRITDSSGEVLYDLADDETAITPLRVADERAAYIITDMLSDNDARTPAFGPSSPLNVGVPAAAKTGTTNDYNDNWTLGYTPYLTVGVWAGNSDNSPMRNSSGVTGAAPIWNSFMRNVAADAETREIVIAAREAYDLPFSTRFEEPAGVSTAKVCVVQSLRELSSSCLVYRDELFPEEAAPAESPLEAPLPEQMLGSDGQPVAGPTGDVWTIVPSVVVPLPGPPPEAVAAAEAEGEELEWPPALLCLPGEGEYGMDKAQPVAVLPLPPEEPYVVTWIGEESPDVIEWAQSHGWSALAPQEPCTPEMVSAALERGTLPGPTDVLAGLGLPLPSRAEYHLNLAPDSELSAQTILTGTVIYNPDDIEYFKVELGRGRSPTEWITLGDVHRGAVVDAPLEVLDAPSLPDDDYIVRLVLVKKDGNFLNPPHSVPIRIVH